MAEPKTYPCKLKPGYKHSHDGRNLMAGETVELTDRQISVLKDKFELPQGYVPQDMHAATDFVDPLTGQANRLPPSGQVPLENPQYGLEKTREKEAAQERVRSEAAKK